MARLYLFAEGQTEQTFAHTVLRPHLAEYGVYMGKPVLVANSHKKHRTHRGGVRDFCPMQRDIKRFLKQDSSPDAFFTSMLDLHALPRKFPGSGEAEKFRDDPYRRVEAFEQSWANETGDCRFIPHIQLHEYEAYLFVDISVLAKHFEGQQTAVLKLQESVNRIESPELIDDGPETAPSRRIIGALPRYRSKKLAVGVQAAESIGLSAIRSKCPHFCRWLARLERLGAMGEMGEGRKV